MANRGPQLGLSTMPLPELALPELLALARQQVAESYDLAAEHIYRALAESPRRDWAAEIRNSRAAVWSISSVEQVTFADLSQRERVLDQTHQLCEFGNRCGASYLVVTPGDLPDSLTSREARAESVPVLRELAQIALNADMGIAVEFRGHPGCSLRTLAETLHVVYKADRVNLGLALDSYHFAIGGSERVNLRKIDPRSLFLVRAVGLDWQDAEGDDEAAARYLAEHGTLPARLLPGQGSYDGAAVLGPILEDGYRKLLVSSPDPTTLGDTPVGQRAQRLMTSLHEFAGRVLRTVHG